MAKNLSFNVKIFLENAGVLPELQYRMTHLAPAFQAIFQEWVELNAQKFEQAVGAELEGADIFGEEWAPVTQQYYEKKHSMGKAKVTRKAARGGKANFEGPYADWLLVRTGALRDALINPDALFSNIQDDQAVFGTPTDPDLADIVAWQSAPRQKGRSVVFLSDPDMNAIRRIIQDYLAMGGEFQQMRSTAGLAAVNQASEIEQMDAEFNVATGA